MAVLVKNLLELKTGVLGVSELKTVEGVQKVLIEARHDLKTYLEDCASKEIQMDRLKKLLVCLKCGYHTEDTLKVWMDQSIDQIVESAKDYSIVYVYPHADGTVDMRIEDSDRIAAWILGLDGFSADIDGESLWIRNNGMSLLQFKFHWRNIFFGIKTPSVEIFDRVRHI